MHFHLVTGTDQRTGVRWISHREKHRLHGARSACGLAQREVDRADKRRILWFLWEVHFRCVLITVLDQERCLEAASVQLWRILQLDTDETVFGPAFLAGATGRERHT